jgi:hypothetical protein
MKTNKKPFEYTVIKSFEDACAKLGLDPLVLPDVSMIDQSLQKSIIANYKLCIIYKVINNGWVPDFINSNQCKYYPWFKVLSSGLVYSNASYNYDSTFTYVGVHLYTDTSVKAEYIGKQFKDIYGDYLL